MSDGFDLTTHLREKNRDLERRVVLLEAEERRLYRVLSLALLVATGDGRECDPLVLLELLCAIDGTEPARPAWVEERDRERNEAETARVLGVLKETNPDRAEVFGAAA